jgi:hemolysin III
VTYSKELPKYTKGEEIFNAVSHIVGGGFGVVALVLGIIFAAIYSDAYGVVSMIVYGVSLILLYTMSAIYHFLHPNKAKRVFRVFDHCTIFLLIAGTYTPFCLVTLRNEGYIGWLMFGLVWFFAILGIVGNAINMHHPVIKTLSMICYIAMGWCIILAIRPLLNNISMTGFILLLSGGISYTIGAIFYGFGKKAKYIHSVWHLFVLFGSILQFFSVLLYVIIKI